MSVVELPPERALPLAVAFHQAVEGYFAKPWDEIARNNLIIIANKIYQESAQINYEQGKEGQDHIIPTIDALLQWIINYANIDQDKLITLQTLIEYNTRINAHDIEKNSFPVLNLAYTVYSEQRDNASNRPFKSINKIIMLLAELNELQEQYPDNQKLQQSRSHLNLIVYRQLSLPLSKQIENYQSFMNEIKMTCNAYKPTSKTDLNIKRLFMQLVRNLMESLHDLYKNEEDATKAMRKMVSKMKDATEIPKDSIAVKGGIHK